MSSLSHEELTDLLDWKRRIFELYALIRNTADPRAAWAIWKETRDELFTKHPSSPIPADDRKSFQGLIYFDYTHALRVMGEVETIESQHFDISTSGKDSFGFTRYAAVSFELHERMHKLDLYWLDGYGGGLFLPFKDTTAGQQTYGGGRYLLDTAKGSDLGNGDGQMVLDFNFAYNPSCSYDPRWVCPLAPPGSRIEESIEAGEKHQA